MVQGASPIAELVAQDLPPLGTMEREYRFPRFSLWTAVRYQFPVAGDARERSRY